MISWILILLFILVPAVGQMLAKMRQVPPAGGGPRPARPVPADITDEIETFMRRVMGEKAPEAKAKPAPRPEPRPVVLTVEQPVQAVVIAEEPTGEEVDKHVKTFLDAREFTDRSSRLGGEVVQADEQFEEHVHQVFDHTLGQLGQAVKEVPAAAPMADLSGTAPVEMPPTVAVGWAAMLSNAESVAQAIVLSEIIRRPEERWA